MQINILMIPFIHQEVEHILSSMAYRSIPSMGEGSNSTASDPSDSVLTPKPDSIRSPEDNSNASESLDKEDRISAIEEIELLIKNLGPPGNLLATRFFFFFFFFFFFETELFLCN